MMSKARSVDRHSRRNALKLHGQIAREVAGSILAGRYRPGEILEGEVASCQQLRVSRTTYREAMKIVMAKGLVTMVPRVGTRVTPRESWHWLDPEVASWLLEDQSMPEQLRSLFELRRAVEPEAAFLSASRRSADDVARMAAALMPNEVPSVRASERQLSEAFWSALYTSTKNVYLQALGQVLAQIRNEPPTSGHPIDDDANNVRHAYTRIFDAIAVGDGERAREASICVLEAAAEAMVRDSALETSRMY
jgi:DNA-binding FadR family transcriptional regulator